MKHCGRIAVAIYVSFFAFCSNAQSTPPVRGGDTPGKTPPVSKADPKAKPGKTDPSKPATSEEQLAAAWSAFYAGKYDDAIDAAEKLDKDKSGPIRTQATHLSARALYATGTKASFDKAWRLWKELSRSTNNANLARLEISKALEWEHREEFGSGIAVLEGVLKKQLGETSTAEAAIDLARLYVKAKKFDDAEKTLNFAIAFLNEQTRKEMTKVEAEPFMQAAKAALARLKYDRDAGLEAFEKADRLRADGKYKEAIAAYQAIISTYPNGDYAPRSGYSIGLCLAGQGQDKKAIEHWKNFITKSPAGAWRGQAYVALVDRFLETDLNLADAAKYATLAKGNLSGALADPKTDNSWRQAAFDVSLRNGVVAFCQGDSKTAAESFAAAQTRAPSKEIADSLDTLIATAKAGKPVIPEDVKGKETKKGLAQAPLALSLGFIYYATGRYDNAQAYFDRVLGIDRTASGKTGSPSKPGTGPDARGVTPAKPADLHPMKDATPAQVAFSIFGQGAIQQAKNKLADAKAQFQASMKSYPDGTWHDETLYRIATIIQDQADAKYAKATADAATSGTGVPPASPGKIASSRPSAEKPATSNEAAAKVAETAAKAAAKTEKDRRAALAKAQGEALSCWQDLVKKYPKSPRYEEAMYYQGVLMCEMAEVAPDNKAEQIWKDAADKLKLFCEAEPKSSLCGDAAIRLADVALERLLDLKRAQSASDLGVAWAKKQVDSITDENEQKDSEHRLWQLPSVATSQMTLEDMTYNCLLRAAIIAYMSGKMDDAAELVKLAGPRSPNESASTDSEIQAIGLHYLQKVILSKRQVTDQRALTAVTSDAQRIILQLGDLYLEAIRPDKAEKVFLRVANHEPILGNVPMAVEAYAMVKISVALDRQLSKRSQALAWLQSLSRDSRFKGTYWGGYGLFLFALFTDNQTQDPQKALPLYAQMIKDYPDHEKAERTYVYYCLDLLMVGDHEKADKIFSTFSKKFPESKFLPPLQKKMQESNSNAKKGK